MLNYFELHKILWIFYNFSALRWGLLGRQSPVYFTYIVNSMAADDLATQGAKASAAMVSMGSPGIFRHQHEKSFHDRLCKDSGKIMHISSSKRFFIFKIMHGHWNGIIALTRGDGSVEPEALIAHVLIEGVRVKDGEGQTAVQHGVQHHAPRRRSTQCKRHDQFCF